MNRSVLHQLRRREVNNKIDMSPTLFFFLTPYKSIIKKVSLSSSTATKSFTKSLSSSSSSGGDSNSNIPPPSWRQLRIYGFAHALPMVGFGFMDQTVMLQAGNAIDCSIGVTFGISTLTAAAVGQVCSNAAGIAFGGTIENLALRAGLPTSNLSSKQKALPSLRRFRVLAQLVGVVFGCVLGLSNLLFIDTNRSSGLKLQKRLTALPADRGATSIDEKEEEREQHQKQMGFEIEASDNLHSNATTFIVRGPSGEGGDIDGLLVSSIMKAFTSNNFSLVELSVRDVKSSSSSDFTKDGDIIFEDIFVVVNKKTKNQLTKEQSEKMKKVLVNVTASSMTPN